MSVRIFDGLGMYRGMALTCGGMDFLNPATVRVCAGTVTVLVIPRITLYRTKNAGICNNIGRQPEAGFTLCSL